MPAVIIPPQYAGWWRIIETERWDAGVLDMFGPAVISFGNRHGDRLRMIAIVGHVNASYTRNGISFSWRGASKDDPISGAGRARLGEDGRLTGTIKIEGSENSTFVAERCAAPSKPILDAPSNRDERHTRR
jgi:hypothetical protein